MDHGRLHTFHSLPCSLQRICDSHRRCLHCNAPRTWACTPCSRLRMVLGLFCHPCPPGPPPTDSRVCKRWRFAALSSWHTSPALQVSSATAKPARANAIFKVLLAITVVGGFRHGEDALKHRDLSLCKHL